MGRNLLIFAFLVVFCIHGSLQLSCFPCTPEDIASCPSVGSLGCQYGEGKVLCDCCYSCLKGPGETCGGPWHLEGKCGIKLNCVSSNEAIDTRESSLKGICQF